MLDLSWEQLGALSVEEILDFFMLLLISPQLQPGCCAWLTAQCCVKPHGRLQDYQQGRLTFPDLSERLYSSFGISQAYIKAREYLSMGLPLVIIGLPVFPGWTAPLPRFPLPATRRQTKLVLFKTSHGLRRVYCEILMGCQECVTSNLLYQS